MLTLLDVKFKVEFKLKCPSMGNLLKQLMCSSSTKWNSAKGQELAVADRHFAAE